MHTFLNTYLAYLRTLATMAQGVLDINASILLGPFRIPLTLTPRVILGLFLSLCISSVVLASPSRASQDFDAYTLDREGAHNLSHGAYYLEDPANQWSVDEAMAQTNWQRNDRNSLMLGYSQSAYWVRVDLNVVMPDRWYLEIGYPVLDFLDVYWVHDGQTLNHDRAGDRIPFKQRPIQTRNFVFMRDLVADEKVSLLLRVKTEGSYQIPIQLKSSQSFQESLSKTEFMLGMFYGVLFIMTIYNLVLYLITNVGSYLYYVLYVMTTLLSRMAFDGSGFELLWPNSPQANEWILPIGFQLSTLAFLLFSYRFLDVRRGPLAIQYLFKGLFLVLLILLVLMTMLDYRINVQLQSLLAAIALVASLLLSMYMTVAGSWYAAVFCIATMLSSMAFVISVFAALGKFDDPDISIYGYAYARVFEIILFAIALGVRIRHINQLRIHAEQEAQASREQSIRNLQQYQRLYENALTGNVVLAGDGMITSSNQSFLKILSLKSDELDNQKIDRFFPGESFDLLRKRCDGHTPVIEEELQAHNGKWLSMLLHRVSVSAEHEFECTFLDITDRKESEQVQSQAQQDKMNSLQQLVVGIAHEINTPLGIVRTSSDFTRETLEKLQGVSEKGELTKELFETEIEASQDALKLADENIIRLGDMIASFKQVSVQQLSYASEELDVDQLIEHLDQLKSDHNVQLNHTIKNQCFSHFTTFPLAIYWVVDELVKNSAFHCKEKIDIKVDCQININDRFLEIKFSDNGVGVTPDKINHIFEPFYTTRRGSDRKLGLGLYQVYNLITQLLKGTIQAESNGGLAVEIRIPNLRFEARRDIASGAHVPV